MIRTVSELLEALVETGAQEVERFGDVEHAGLEGEVYEGLAGAALNRALFEGLDLRVASGKIRNSQGALSRQIDRMIVRGDGERIPHTDKMVYPISHVVAVVEVKKTLLGEELGDALDLMRDLRHRIGEARPPSVRLIRDAWRGTMRERLPDPKRVDELPVRKAKMYYALVVDGTMPVRVVWGFHGYRTELTLRRGFVQLLTKRKGASGSAPVPHGGPTSFPELIICGGHALYKLNGMPFASPIREDGFWPFMGSTSRDVLELLLEFIWTRLSYEMGVPSRVFGEDLELQTGNLLLMGRVVEHESVVGWEYEWLPAKAGDLAIEDGYRRWDPEELTSEEFVVVNQLCRGERVSLADPELIEWLRKAETSAHALAASLRSKGLAATDADDLYLLTDECDCVILPDGRYVAGENKSGRLRRWVDRYIAATRQRGGSTPPDERAPTDA